MPVQLYPSSAPISARGRRRAGDYAQNKRRNDQQTRPLSHQRYVVVPCLDEAFAIITASGFREVDDAGQTVKMIVTGHQLDS